MRFGLSLGACTVVCALLALTPRLFSAPPDEKARQIACGKYLAIGIGGCQDCHTPRDQQGQFPDKWLHGSALFMLKPAFPIPGWTSQAPGIAGLPNSTDQAITFLTTGVAPDGTQASPPMPQHRFNRSDAKAVVAYLRSLKAAPQPLGHDTGKQ
jgi:mono/diheme cytochrome c family protein